MDPAPPDSAMAGLERKTYMLDRDYLRHASVRLAHVLRTVRHRRAAHLGLGLLVVADGSDATPPSRQDEAKRKRAGR